MHAWICDNPMGPQALSWKEVPAAEPKAGEVRIAIRAASLNFPDLLIVQNKYQVKPPCRLFRGRNTPAQSTRSAMASST